MKLEEAIKHQERRVASPFVRAHSDSENAMQLGIEAMKREKKYREDHPDVAPYLLPGETK